MNKSAPNTERAAKAAGISLVTLQRWIADGRVHPPKLQIRNGRAVRVWSWRQLQRLLKTKNAIYCRGRGRKALRKSGVQ
jgi:predicted site-specific integrase-resolvase